VLEEEADSFDDHERLAGTSTCDHDGRSVAGFDDPSLLFG